MTKRMLIDATHAEETRVVVLDGSRLEDFDVETASKKQLKGNIYLAKVVRVEPSLQAAFVEYGGNRHGFLAFGEIHPDYYQIPVADRQRLIEMQLEDARQEAEEEDRAAAAAAARAGEPAEPDAEPAAEPTEEAPPPGEPAPTEMDSGETVPEAAATEASDAPAPEAPAPEAAIPGGHTPVAGGSDAPSDSQSDSQSGRAQPAEIAAERIVAPDEPLTAPVPADHVVVHLGEALPAAPAEGESTTDPEAAGEAAAIAAEDEAAAADAVPADSMEVIEDRLSGNPGIEEVEDEPPPPPESLGGDTVEEPRERRIPPRFLRNYKIQEVIKRRQILLIQVVKEERGTKGAALTTYISLAGRYSVLMPNSPRGGGISRKITSAADRRRLKEVTAELNLPKGMGLIVRTAGANRPKPEIKRDCEYLLRLWDDIREHTMRSVAPALIYEEASLIKRAIRDVYSRDIDEIQVDGEEGWKAAHDFMRMLMPSHAGKVRMWRDSQPLFARQGVEAQLDSMLSPTVQLRSGGYLVINQAEALVAIDVNSGRSTRERNIEETALRTNLEAADEAARQLRLRDLAGLIVIDFIDMESRKHNAMVERRLKEALKNDRARIQVGQISHFGLLEMSRQRLRPSLAETSLITCPHCGGTGHVRSVDTAALHVLRQVEEEGAKRRAAEIVVHVAGAVAMYILNHKRARLAEIEARYGMSITFAADEKLIAPEIRIERVRAAIPAELPPAIQADQPPPALPAPAYEPEDEAETGEVEAAADPAAEDEDDTRAAAGESAEEGERRRRRRRRRRGGRREDGTTSEITSAEEPEAATGDEIEQAVEAAIAETIAAPGPAETSLADVSEHIEGVPEFAEPAGSGPSPDEAAAEAETDGERGTRRRGRRGGRRRRRDDDAVAAVAEPGAEQPELPAYAGPTPADPFAAQGFDIFAIMEQAEQAAEQSATGPAAEPAVPSAVEAVAIEPVAEAAPEPAPVALEQPETPAADVPPEAAPSESDQPADAAAPATVATTALPELEAVAVEPEKAEPAVKPIVIGVDETPEAPKKRGWWRR